MAKRYAQIRVSLDGIDAAIKMLDDYIERLQWKCELFVQKLADVGINVAKQNILVEDDGVMVDRSDLVYFEKDVASSVDGAVCIVVPYSNPYISTWKKSKNGTDILSAEVDPLLMAEFGSGAHAIEGHRGTFPSATAQKNAAHGSWAWYDEGGVKHISTGNVPSRPIYKAKEEMLQQIENVAIEVFSTV